MFESIRHLLHSIYDVEGLIRSVGPYAPLLVCIIVFVETGLFVGFFLPGDSLLVTAGVFAAAGTIPLRWLLLPVMLCAIVGDQIGYWIGRGAGVSLYKRKESFFFRRSHLERARAFYEKYGGKTVILARFVPIVRTFCPPVAGAAGMPYSRYVSVRYFWRDLVGRQHDFGRLFVRPLDPRCWKENPLCNRGGSGGFAASRGDQHSSRTPRSEE